MYRSDRVTTLSEHAKSLFATDSRRPGGAEHSGAEHSGAEHSGAKHRAAKPGVKHRYGKRLAGTRGPKRTVVLAGAALALAGAGTACAATASAATASPATSSGTVALPVAPGSAGVLTRPLTLKSPLHAAALSASQPGPGQSGPGHAAPSHTAPSQPAPLTWLQIRNKINEETFGPSVLQGKVPYAGRLMPVGTSGQQGWMPLNEAQVQNATTIVQQAFAKKMGIRSAVIAVATAMQESRLLNIDYGSGDSLGLFQQQADMGWGSAQQIMDPTYAADAFLDALGQYQAQNSSWAQQPLWANAQAVQRSGFPFAYAQWETQAAGLVKQIATQMVTSQQ